MRLRTYSRHCVLKALNGYENEAQFCFFYDNSSNYFVTYMSQLHYQLY